MKTFSDNFKRFKVAATAIEWDTDGEKVDLPNEVAYVYDKNDLIDRGILETDTDTGDLALDEETLVEEISDRLSDDYGWCHSGFGISYNLLTR